MKEIPIEDKGAGHKKMLFDSLSVNGEGHFQSDQFRALISWERMLLGSDDIPDILAVVWLDHFPIDVYTSRKIVDKAKRMPKDHIKSIIFPLYELGAEEDLFFEMLISFGSGIGLDLVTAELFDGARSGDPRAVKMYLEMQEYISGLGLEIEDKGPKGGLLVNFNMTGKLAEIVDKK
jgi:hypothetical protein